VAWGFLAVGTAGLAFRLIDCMVRLFVWLRDCDQEPCVYGLGVFGHWHSWSCVLID